jgi:predicted nucleic acid-binding Zn ribbon protein
MQKITDKPLSTCPSCGGAMKKMISSTSFVLKGSGWYATDYAGKSEKEVKEVADKKEKPETSSKKEPEKASTAETSASAETKK